MDSPVVVATLQNCAISATGNILAQLIAAWKNDSSFSINFTPVMQYIVYGVLNAPLNFFWQSFLESTFPSKPQPSVNGKKFNSDPSLSVRNTITKVVIDQTIGSTWNILLYLFLFSYFHGATDATQAWNESVDSFWPVMYAGWKLWPAVSLVCFAAVKTVSGRILVGSLAGLGWNIFLGLRGA